LIADSCRAPCEEMLDRKKGKLTFPAPLLTAADDREDGAIG
jgi:hypothetical protein